MVTLKGYPQCRWILHFSFGHVTRTPTSLWKYDLPLGFIGVIPNWLHVWVCYHGSLARPYMAWAFWSSPFGQIKLYFNYVKKVIFQYTYTDNWIAYPTYPNDTSIGHGIQLNPGASWTCIFRLDTCWFSGIRPKSIIWAPRPNVHIFFSKPTVGLNLSNK